MQSISFIAFWHRCTPLVQLAVKVGSHVEINYVNVFLCRTICSDMPKRGSSTHHPSRRQPLRKVLKLSELNLPAEHTVGHLNPPAQNLQIFEMAMGTAQADSVFSEMNPTTEKSCSDSQKEETKSCISDVGMHSNRAELEDMSQKVPSEEVLQKKQKPKFGADAQSKHTGLTGDSLHHGEVARAENPAGGNLRGGRRAPRGQRSSAQTSDHKRGETVEGTVQSESGPAASLALAEMHLPPGSGKSNAKSRYSQFASQNRQAGLRAAAMREETDDSVRSSDDPWSSGSTDAGKGAKEKRHNATGSRTAQRSRMFVRKQVAPRPAVEEHETSGESKDCVTEKLNIDGEKRRRRRRQRNLPSVGLSQLEASETKPGSESAVHRAEGLNQRDSTSSDGAGSLLKQNPSFGSSKLQAQTGKRTRRRRNTNQLGQVLKKSADGIDTVEHKPKESTDSSLPKGGECSISSVGGIPNNETALPSGRQAAGRGRGKSQPGRGDQAYHRSVTFYRKQSSQNSSGKGENTEPNPKEMTGMTEKSEASQPRRVRRRNRKENEKMKSEPPGGRNKQQMLVSSDLQSKTDSSEILQQSVAEQGIEKTESASPQGCNEEQGKTEEILEGASDLGAKADKDLSQRKGRPPKVLERKSTPSACADAEAVGTEEQSEVADSGVALTEGGPSTTPTEAQKKKKNRRFRRKRKLLPEELVTTSVTTSGKNAEAVQTPVEASDLQPSEITPKRKKEGIADKLAGVMSALSVDAKTIKNAVPVLGTVATNDGRKSAGKQRRKVLPATLLSQVTAHVKGDPSMASKMGKASSAKQGRRDADSLKGGRKHRSSESDGVQEDAKKVKLSSGSGGDGVSLSAQDDMGRETVGPSATATETDDILDTVDVSLLFSKKFDKEYQNFVKRAKKRQQRKKKQGGSAGGNDEVDDKNTKKFQKAQALRPNYFIAIQITDAEVQENLQRVQKRMVLGNLGLMPALIPLPTLHLTLAVMHLASQTDIDRVKVALDACAKELRGQFSTDPLELQVSGMDNFRNQVVFAKVKPDEGLQMLEAVADSVDKFLTDQGVATTDKNGFKAHITLMKMSKAFAQLRRKGIKSIAPGLYSDFCQSDFGVQLAHKLQLCAMMKKKREDGYYFVEHEAEFAPESGEITALRQFCRRLVRQSIDAAQQQVGEKWGLTAEAEKEAELAELSKAIVALSIQGAVEKLKWEQRTDKKWKKKKGAQTQTGTAAARSDEKAGSQRKVEGGRSDADGEIPDDAEKASAAELAPESMAGGVTVPTELDEFCQRVVEDCISGALHHFQEKDSEPCKENDDDITNDQPEKNVTSGDDK